ncbi:hypothetical protein, partial [Pseudoxanthomonas sp. KAs_5_3]
VPPPPAKPGAKPAKAAAPGKGGGKGKDKDKGKDKVKPDEMKNFADAMKKIKALEGHKPMSREEINSTVDAIKKQYNVPGINVIPKDTNKWKVT